MIPSPKHSLVGLLLLLVCCISFAQTFPSKPIRIVHGNPPGTTSDIMLRPIAEEMSRRMGQPVLVESKPGANATIGAKAVATAPPDGYMLFFSIAMQHDSLFNKNNAVDAKKEFLPISQLVSTPWVLVTRSSLPVTSLQELAAYSKANPEKLTAGVTAPIVELAVKVLGDRAGFTARTIPYKGSPAVMVALLSGEVDLGIGAAQTYLAQFEAGKLRALVTVSEKRSSAVPNVPAMPEVGMGRFEVPANYGLWAPLGTSREVIQKLNLEAVAAVKQPAVAEQIRKATGGEILGTTPEEQLRMYDEEVKFWREGVRITNFKVE